MNNIKIKAGPLLLGTVLLWLVATFLAYATAGIRGEAYMNGTLLLLCAPALLYLLWFVSESLF